MISSSLFQYPWEFYFAVRRYQNSFAGHLSFKMALKIYEEVDLY